MRDQQEQSGTVGADQVYDGFISYSHAADGLLAPRLQAGLQRFAKPWWKRRAVRIFRDESSLSANPHLWSSITDALDSSGWFVLLLSPDAAQSEWVNQEIAYWKTHRDPSRILPVVTDGEFGWADGDVAGDAVPDQLRGVFSDEPRWVDLRWARDEDQLDLKDPRFADAVADIASALRGVPKDDLSSEEVRQYRRTVRTAWSAGGLVLALAVVAVWAGVLSARNAVEAERQTEIALENERRAEANAAEAERQAEIAEANAAAEAEARAAAEASAAEARSRELGTAAFEAVEDDPELATLLALEAIHRGGDPSEQPPVVLNSLWTAIESNRLEWSLRPGEQQYGHLSLFPDDRRLAFTDQAMLAVYQVPEGELVWRYEEPDSPDAFVMPAVSPDGSLIALSVADSRSDTFPGIPSRPEDDRPNRIRILDAATGEVVHTVEYPGCEVAFAPAWSPSGDFLAVSNGWGDCERNGVEGAWVELVDVSSFETSVTIPFGPALGVGPFPQFRPNDDLVLLGFENDAVVYQGPDYSSSTPLEGSVGFGAVSPDGRWLATFSPSRADGFVLYDIDRRTRIDVLQVPTFPSLPVPMVFSDDSTRLAVGTEGRDALIFDVGTGEELYRLPGGAGTAPALSSDGHWAYTAHFDGTLSAWSLEPRAVGQTVVEDLGANFHVQASPQFWRGPELAAAYLLDFAENPFVTFTVLFDPGSGAILHEIEEFWQARPLANGTFVGRASVTEIGIYDPATEIVTLIAGCPSSDETLPPTCDDTGQEAPNLSFVVSQDQTEILLWDIGTKEWWIVSPDDGSVIVEGSYPIPGEMAVVGSDWLGGYPDSERFAVWDRTTGELISQIEASLNTHAVNRVGDEMILLRPGGIVLFDLISHEATFVELDVDRVRGKAFSPSGDLLALGDENVVLIIDVDEQEVIRRLPIAGASSFWWFDEETFLVGTSYPARWVSVSLDVTELDRAGRDSVSRSFTASECREYLIDPCPTLEEIRNR